MCFLPLMKTSEIHCLNINTQVGIKNTTKFEKFLKNFFLEIYTLVTSVSTSH